MNLNVEYVLKMIGDREKRQSEIGSLLLSYGDLKSKMDNFSGQNWYFRKAEESNLKKLEDMRKDFDQFKRDFETLTVDELISRKKELETEINETIGNKSMSRTIKSIVVDIKSNNLNYIKELLSVKSKIDEIHAIDFYPENPDEILKLL